MRMSDLRHSYVANPGAIRTIPEMRETVWRVVMPAFIHSNTAFLRELHDSGEVGTTTAKRHSKIPWAGAATAATGRVAPLVFQGGRNTLQQIKTTHVTQTGSGIGGWLVDMHNLPEPPGSAQPSSMEQHYLPQAPIMLPTQPPPRTRSALNSPPRGWVGKRIKNCLRMKYKQGFAKGEGTHCTKKG